MPETTTSVRPRLRMISRGTGPPGALDAPLSVEGDSFGPMFTATFSEKAIHARRRIRLNFPKSDVAE